MARPKSLIHEHAALRQAALRIYVAGHWLREKSSDRKADEKLWEELRDALHLPPGTTDHIPR